MANFDLAFRFMAPHEWNQRRNFTNDPHDPGGPTKWGITLKSWQLQGSLGDLDGDGDVDVDDLKLTTETEAREFYRNRYWIWEGVHDDRIATKLFDMGVNMGVGTAVGYLQRVLNGLGYGLKVDFKLGPKTLAAANAADPDRVMLGLVKIQAQHYAEWIAKKSEREKYRIGLAARATAIPAFVQAATRNA